MDPTHITAEPHTSPPFHDMPHKEQPTLQKEDLLPHWDSLNVCSGPGNARHFLARRKKRKEEGIFETLRSWIVDHQIGISINLLLLLGLAHICFPKARSRTRSFFELSYHNPTTGRYMKGVDDLFFVFYWIIIFTGLRAAVMTYILLPLAQSAGLKKTKTKVRFAEQAWLALYYAVFWSLGMYIMYHSKYWLQLRELWTDFPELTVDGTLKWYYLVQFAFWLQQIIVVNIEERRKDHWQMFTHHIVTCALILTSYGYNQTRIGNVILCVMDVVDLVLPVAKLLKYTGFQTACNIAFGVFVLTWISARHVLYLTVCWSIWVDVPREIVFGCYDGISGTYLHPYKGHDVLTHIFRPFLRSRDPVCLNKEIWYGFIGLLLILQGITIMWLVMILRVVWNVIKGNGADDSRSDDEAEAEDDGLSAEDQQNVPLDAKPVEQLVGVEELNLKKRGGGSSRYRTRKPGTSSSALSITGHSDRKELLGRIGCDKPS